MKGAGNGAHEGLDLQHQAVHDVCELASKKVVLLQPLLLRGPRPLTATLLCITSYIPLPSKYPPGFHTVDTHGNLWKPVYIPRGNYGNCCIGNPWKPMETIAFWKPMETHCNHIYGNL